MRLDCVLRVASWLAPTAGREEWLAEWRGELEYIRSNRQRAAAAFCRGAFLDALWLRLHDVDPRRSRPWKLDSPAVCLLLLTLLTASAVLVGVSASRAPGRLADARMAKQGRRMNRPLRPELMIAIAVAMALLILPAVTTLPRCQYPRRPFSRRWCFFFVKIGLVVPLVYFASVDLARWLGPPVQPHGLMLGYVLAFRWALLDQRQRCPVCLHRLAYPTRIGASSNLLLAWYGTELVCTRGHGVLHVPGIPISSYSGERWQHLDSSWGALFGKGSTPVA